MAEADTSSLTISRAIRLPAGVAACIASANRARTGGRWSEAIQWLAGAAVLDIQQHHSTFLVGAAEAGMLSDQLAVCFEGAGLKQMDPEDCSGPSCSHRPLRLGYITSSIVEGQAAAGRLTRMLELHDRTRFEPHLIVTDEFTERSPPRAWLKWPMAPSRHVGADLLARIERSGVKPRFLPTRGDDIDGARAAVDIARSMQLDIAVFVASPACPIQAAMAWTRVAPLQINQNIAVPLPMAGIDAVLYHNAWCAREDEQELARRGIRTLIVSGNGTDLNAAAGALSEDRLSLGVPSQALLMATAGNHLQGRLLHGSFLHDLGSFMREHTDAWWMVIGPGDFAEVRRTLESHAGPAVTRRVVWTGPQRDIRGFLKAADIYLNEYPEGGANTVLESMACGVPVVALRAGPRHTESIGPALVGEQSAIGTDDVASYWRAAGAWCTDESARRAAGLSQQRRVRDRLGYAAICDEYQSCYMHMIGRE